MFGLGNLVGVEVALSRRVGRNGINKPIARWNQSRPDLARDGRTI
jgi:hypothetical protein